MTNAVSVTAHEAALSNPWRDDDGRPLATLLALEEWPGSSSSGCVWFLGRLDIDHQGRSAGGVACCT